MVEDLDHAGEVLAAIWVDRYGLPPSNPSARRAWMHKALFDDGIEIFGLTTEAAKMEADKSLADAIAHGHSFITAKAGRLN
jgi:hypothetical protein